MKKTIILALIIFSSLALAETNIPPTQQDRLPQGHISRVQLPGETIFLIPTDIVFQRNSAELRPLGHELLEEIARGIKQSPNKHIDITTNTDSIGAQIDYEDRALSDKQLNKIMGFLWSQGIDINNHQQITYASLKDQNPIASNKTLFGMAENRRVEIIVSD